MPVRFNTAPSCISQCNTLRCATDYEPLVTGHYFPECEGGLQQLYQYFGTAVVCVFRLSRGRTDVLHRQLGALGTPFMLQLCSNLLHSSRVSDPGTQLRHLKVTAKCWTPYRKHNVSSEDLSYIYVGSETAGYFVRHLGVCLLSALFKTLGQSFSECYSVLA